MEKQNRNNRVHTIQSGNSDEFPIASLLPFGEENAVATDQLVKMTGCKSARELQQYIARERDLGAVICSGSGRGYWRPKNRQELQRFVKTMRNRALNTLKATKSARSALKAAEGQQEIENDERITRE